MYIFGVKWPRLLIFFVTFWENIAFFEKIVRRKNIQNLISHKKGYIHFPRQTLPSHQNKPGPQKLFFAVFSENTAYKIFSTYFEIKKLC